MKKYASLATSMLAIFSVTASVCGQEPMIVNTFSHKGPITCMAYSPDGEYLFSGSGDDVAMLWDPNGPRTLGKLTLEKGSINDVVFTPDSQQVVFVTDFGRKIRFWDAQSQKTAREFAVPVKSVGSLLAISSDGRLIATQFFHDILLIDAATGKLQDKLTGHTENASDIVFAADGQHLVSCASDGVKIWDLETKKILHTIPLKNNSPDRADVSPDSKTIAIVGNGWVHTADLKTGELLKSVRGHQFRFGDVAFSSDGKTIASGDSGGTLKVWNVSPLEEKHQLTYSKSEGITRVAFSPDGSKLAAAGGETFIAVWKVGEPMPIASAKQPAATKPPTNSTDPSDAKNPLRTWTSGGGKFKVQARFLKYDGANVHLELESGRVVKVPLKKLDEAHQQYIRDLAKKSKS